LKPIDPAPIMVARFMYTIMVCCEETPPSTVCHRFNRFSGSF